MARKAKATGSLGAIRQLLTTQTLQKENLRVEEWESALIISRDNLRIILFDADEADPDSVEKLLERAGGMGVGFLAAASDPERAASFREHDDHFLGILYLPIGPKCLTVALHNLFRSLALEQGQIEAERSLKDSLDELKELNQIGIALSGERNIDKLLGLIVERARYITQSDAGSLYIIEEGEGNQPRWMRFKIAQNDTLNISFSEFTLPIDKKSISGFVAATGQTLNIDDAYLISPDMEYKHNKSFDERNGYRSKSMLTVPMKNRSGEIIGVLQLMNRKKRRDARLVPVERVEEEVIPYQAQTVALVESLASQAAVSLENALLYDEIQTLFDSFVRASVTAIESRDPTTHGHSNRVAILTVGLAEAVDHSDDPLWRNVKFSRDDLKEIEYAGLLHDFGKIGVREEVLIKAKKLYPWDWEMLKARFDFIQRTLEKEHLARKLDFIQKYGMEKAKEEFETIDKFFRAECEALKEDIGIIEASNLPTVLPVGGFERLKDISQKSFTYMDGSKMPYLTDKEVYNLSLPKGSLNDSERLEIESHVTHTFQYLQKIHWGKTYKEVPIIAFAHHEKLNGRGYPRRLGAHEIPLQSRMMTLADIFDALTASDRPYKKAVPTQRALDILQMEVKEGMLDSKLYQLFLDAKVYEKTAQKPRP